MDDLKLHGPVGLINLVYIEADMSLVYGLGQVDVRWRGFI